MTKSDLLNEAQPQSVRERLARRTRIETPEPAIKSLDKTPHKPANNDPTQTSRGRAALKRQIKRNKRHPGRCAEDIQKSLSDPASAVLLAEELVDPVAEYHRILGNSDFDRAREVIKNVWEGQLMERYAGVCNPGCESCFSDNIARLVSELKEWGSKLVWVEHICKPDYVICKVCGDSTPSEVYAERRMMDDRNIILSHV